MSGQPVPNYESTFPLLPLRGDVLFPGATVPYEIGRPKTVALAEHVVAQNVPYVVVFPQRDAEGRGPRARRPHEHGTLARVVAVEKQRKGTYAVVARGSGPRPARSSIESSTPFLQARVEPVDTPAEATTTSCTALGMSLRDATRQAHRSSCPAFRARSSARVEAIESPADLADFVATYLDASVEEKVELLATLEPKARIRKLLALISRRAEVLRMRDKINSQVKDELGKTQREYVLRQQMKAIQEELGGEATTSRTTSTSSRSASPRRSSRPRRPRSRRSS